MASIISTKTSGVGGLEVTGDASGILQLASNNGTTAVTVDASQNVGIGTSSPAYKLDVNGYGRTIFNLRCKNDATNLSYIGFEQYSSTAQYSYLVGDGRSTGFVAINTNDTERMRIDGSGNLLVGTTSAWTSTKCQINQSATASVLVLKNDTAANNNGVLFGVKAGSTNNTSQVYIEFAYNSGGNGNGGIAGNGDSQCTFITRSDARLKENIDDLPNQLNNICQLRPVEFDYIDTGNRQIGFIAQDVQQIYPDLVSENDDGILVLGGMDKTTARLVKAIQELKAELDTVKAELAELKGAA